MPLHSPISHATLWRGLLHPTEWKNTNRAKQNKAKQTNKQTKQNKTKQNKPNRAKYSNDFSVSNNFSVPTEPFSRRHVTLFCSRLSSDDVPLQAVEATGSSGLQRRWCESMQKMMNYCKKYVNTLWKHAKTCKKKGPIAFTRPQFSTRTFETFHWHIRHLPVNSAWSIRMRFCLAKLGLNDINSMDSQFQWYPNQSESNQSNRNMSNSFKLCRNMEIPTTRQSVKKYLWTVNKQSGC